MISAIRTDKGADEPNILVVVRGGRLKKIKSTSEGTFLEMVRFDRTSNCRRDTRLSSDLYVV